MSQLAQVASLVSQYQAQYQNGELSGSEFKELMESLDCFQHIQATAADLEQDMMCRQIIMGAMQVALFDPELGLDWNKVVHGEQSFEYKKPIKAGDELSFISTIEDIKTKVGNDFITIRSDVKNQNNQDVATLKATLIARGTG